MKLHIFLLVSLVSITSARYLVKRDNSYGDEPVLPVEPSTEAPIVEEGYAAPTVVATESPATEEYAPAEVAQEVATEAPAVEASGYRLKRQAQNSYGDEPIVAEEPSTEAPVVEEGYAAPAEVTTEAPAAAEYAPSEVAQEVATEAPAVEASGYRLKRQAQNSYGDEPIVAEEPSTEAPVVEEGYAAPAEVTTEAPAAAEYAPSEVAQEVATEAPAVEASGYRLKRQAQNSYGDEPIVAEEPSTEAPVVEEGYAAPAEVTTEAPAAAEYAPAEVAQEVATEAPAVEASGYRLKRQAQNSYGDEPIVAEEPSTEAPVVEEGYAAPAEVTTEAPAAAEYAPAEVAQEVATEAPAVEASGYRLKRQAQNSYGDEPIVSEEPSTEAPVVEEGYAAPAEVTTEAPAAAEYAPAEVAQEVATEAPAVEASGYRLKRQAQNSYGDEPIVAEEPSTEAPVVEEGYAAPAEVTTEAPAAAEYAPAEVAQEVATEAPAVEASGYRLKRQAQNSYGDEPIVAEEPSTEAPVVEEGYAAPAEVTTEAPAAAEYAPAEVAQEVATEAPAVEASGYRL